MGVAFQGFYSEVASPNRRRSQRDLAIGCAPENISVDSASFAREAGEAMAVEQRFASNRYIVSKHSSGRAIVPNRNQGRALPGEADSSIR